MLSESQENDANNFIAALNWSGLIFPSEIIVNAVSYVFVVKFYKEEFFKLQNQREFINFFEFRYPLFRRSFVWELFL